jgi:hypothetical protein
VCLPGTMPNERALQIFSDSICPQLIPGNCLLNKHEYLTQPIKVK